MKEFLHNLFRLNMSALFKEPTSNPWIGLFRYCFAGGLAFLIDFGCYLLLTQLGMHYLAAALIAFIISFLVNFLISRKLIFSQNKSSQTVAAEIIKVLGIALIGLLLTEFLLFVCIQLLHLGRLISKVIASIIVLIWNYLGRRYFVYRQSPIKCPAFLKQWSKLALVVLLSIVIGMGALTAVYCIPVDGINENLVKSAAIFKEEGVYPSLDYKVTSQLDNFTDALMLHTAGYRITESPLVEAALINRLECVDAITPVESLIAEAFGEQQEMKIVSYSHYWHGYLVILKPLLTVFTYGQIRTINTVFQYALIVLLFSLLIIKKQYAYTIPTMLLLAFQGMNTTVLSLQFSTIFYIYIIAMMVLLLFYERWKDTPAILLYFTILGIVTAYLDFLTYPLVTYGVPLALLLVMNKKQPFFAQIKTIVSAGFAWILGFAGMWLGKGVVGTLITKKNVFEELFLAVQKRSVGVEEDIAFRTTIDRNISAFLRSYFYDIAVIICAVLFIVLLLRTCKERRIAHIFNNLGFGLLCCAPICWYFVLNEHSYLHYWFTYRECLIILFSVVVMLVKMNLDLQKTEKKPS